MGESKIDCSVIITTYNSPDYLRLVLLSLIDQDMDGFEVIVADDGSSNETKNMVDDIAKESNFSISYVWQPLHDF